jgi:hypothetical protein
MSFNFGTVLSNGFSSFSDDERLNYALKLSLNRIQTWGETPWYEEPQALSSTLPNLILKNKIPSFSEIEQYYIVDPDMGKATNITVNKAVGSADYNNMTIKTIHESTHTSNIPIRSNDGTENVDVINNGETKELLIGVSKKMIAKYVYWEKGLTGKNTNNDGSTPTASDGDNSGTYPDKTEPYASFMTLSNNSGNFFINDRRWSTLESEYNTLYNNLDQYYSGLQIIHWSNIQSDGTAPVDKRHPFFKIFIGLPTYSTYSNALKAKFINLGLGNSQSGDNIGFTNKLLEGAMGSINNYNFYISTWNKKQGKFVKRGEDTYGAGEQNTNILYFVSYSGFILNYGEENILVGKGDDIDRASISIRFPPTISFIKYVGDTFSDGIIAQGPTLPAVEVSNVKDLFINTTDNTIHRLEGENNGTKTWVGIGGSGGGSSGSTQTYTNQILEQSGNEIQVPNDKHTLPFNQFTDVSGSETSFTFNDATTQLIYKFSFNLTWNRPIDRGDTISEYQLMLSEDGVNFTTIKNFRLRNSLFSENFATIEHIIKKKESYTTITIKLQGKSINPDYWQKVNYTYFNPSYPTGSVVKPILEITKIGSRTIEAEALFNKDGNDNIYYTNGNVGVGTNNPTNQLEVYGNTLLLNDLTVNGTAVLKDISGVDASFNNVDICGNKLSAKDIHITGNIYQNGTLFSTLSDGDDLNINNLKLSKNITSSRDEIILNQNEIIVPSNEKYYDLGSSGVTDDKLGGAVVINGNFAVIGKPTTNSSNIGEVYIYKKDNSGVWNQYQILRASITTVDVNKLSGYGDSMRFGNFGGSIGFDGNYIIVGGKAFELETDKYGAAFIFEKGNDGYWGTPVSDQTYYNENQILFGTNEAGHGNILDFGQSVSIHGTTAIVGSNDTRSTGFIFVFEKGNDGKWGTEQTGKNYHTQNVQLTAIIIGSTPQYNGASVAIYGDTIISGARQSFSNRGVVYFYNKDSNGNWGTEITNANYRNINQYFSNPKGDSGPNHFGFAVDIYDNYAIASAPEGSRGYVYIYEKSDTGNWSQIAEVNDVDGNTWERFGHSVSINNNFAIIGKPQHDSTFSGQKGCAYMITKNNEQWGLPSTGSHRLVTFKIVPEGTNRPYANFGSSVSSFNDEIIIGAPNFSGSNANNQGRFYIYNYNSQEGYSYTFRTLSTNLISNSKDKLQLPLYVGIGTASSDPGDPVTYGLIINGNIKANSSYIQTSDDRVKHNEINITNALQTINALQPKKYIKTQELYSKNHNFILDSSNNPIDESGNLIDYFIEAGIIAQEIKEVDELAIFVKGEEVDKNGKPTSLGVDYNSIFCYSLQAIKELDEKNAELKTELATLKTQMSDVLARLSQLESN